MKKILFANPFGIGDVIFSLASAQRIRETYPDVYLGFIGNERTEELLRLCPAVDHVHVFNRDLLRSAWKKSPLLFFHELKKMTSDIAAKKYDTLVDFSLGREFSFAAALAGIRPRIGFDFKGRGIFLTHKKKIMSYKSIPVAQSQLDLLWEAGILPDNRMPEALPIRVSGSAETKKEESTLAVAPGGGRSWGKEALYKQWDIERFSEAVNTVSGMDTKTRVILLGDAPEKELLESVQKKIRSAECVVMAGEPLKKVCAALKSSRFLLCNDGGLLHLAHALGVITVSIFGPVDEKVYGPYGGSTRFRVLTADVPCRPCYQDFHFPPCSYDRRCLTGVSIDKVVEAMKEIL